MASTFHEVLAQSLRDRSDINGVLLAARHQDVVHIDEAHELAPRLQTALCRVIDRRELIADWSGRPVGIPVADFTLLLSTTDEHGLIQPLRDRIAQVLLFDFYSEEDLIRLVDCRSRALNWTIEETVIAEIARRSRGIPRVGLSLLRSCYRLIRAQGQSTITVPTLLTVCALEGIDDLGVLPNEQALLRLIGRGSTRVNVLASQLGLPVRTLTDVIEPFLYRAGLILKDEHSRRQLTAAGHQHLTALCSGGV
jgi:Holliday junction DNA helicase RuvB